jgi:hypothetical protein
MVAQRRHERPHVLVAGSRPSQTVEEDRGGAELSRPPEHVLVSTIDLARAAGCGNRQLVRASPEIRLLDRLCDLAGDLLEDGVAR